MRTARVLRKERVPGARKAGQVRTSKLPDEPPPRRGQPFERRWPQRTGRPEERSRGRTVRHTRWSNTTAFTHGSSCSLFLAGKLTATHHTCDARHYPEASTKCRDTPESESGGRE